MAARTDPELSGAERLGRVSPAPARQVTLVLCTAAGRIVGSLPAFEAPTPYWQEVREVVELARTIHGAEVIVLRLLTAAAAGSAEGGPVTYLAQVRGLPAGDLRSWDGDDPIAPQPYRQSWARPGGPDADLRWADAALTAAGLSRAGPPEQMRSWNLSSLWRLPLADGAAWLKVVPPFFAHEGALLSRLDPAVVPAVLAAEGPRTLLAELPGEDLYGATGAPLLQMIDLLVGLQLTWRTRIDELRALGLPDWRATVFPALAAATLDASSAELGPTVRADLEHLVTGLPARFRAIEACGIPDSLVHGDFHPGNVIATPPAGAGTSPDLRLLDWGDSGVGHPMLDQAAFLQGRSGADRDAGAAHWAGRWRAAVPGCAPERAALLLGPVAALRQAVVYRMFLDHIEPAERAYHAHDPSAWLERAAARFAAERRST